MELLLLKSSVCLLALLLFYKIALEPLSVHKFKRVYLLLAVAIAAIIPFITFVKYVEPTIDTSTFIFDNSSTIPIDTNFKIIEDTNYLPIILWSIYALGVGLFFTRFCINLFQIVSKIRKHTKVKSSHFVNVLMEHLEIPHTFFNFIFLNKTKFENNQIPPEVLLHEQTHAKQKHSLDIIIIELLQVVFWFNPLLYWLKKEVKLNHEFLADQDVINQGVDTKTYQTILLQFSSNQQELALANAINYSSIKKRFTLMNTQTPQKTKWLRSLLLLPLLALLLYSFSSMKEVEKEVIPKAETKAISVIKDYKKQSIVDKQNSTLLVNGIACDGCTLNLSKKGIAELILTTTNQEVITDFKLKIPGVKTLFNEGNMPSNETRQYISRIKKGDLIMLFDIASKSKKYKSLRIQLVDNDDENYSESPKVKKGEESSIPPPPPPPPANPNATPEEKAKQEKVISDYYKNNKVVNGKVLRNPPPPPPPANPNATSEEKAKQEKIIEKYNKENKIVNGKVLRNPPPPPTAPLNSDNTTGFIDINGKPHFYVKIKNQTKYYNRWGIEVNSKGTELSSNQTDGSKVVPGQKLTKIYKNGEVVSEFKKTWEDDETNETSSNALKNQDKRAIIEAKRNERLLSREEKKEILKNYNEERKVETKKRSEQRKLILAEKRAQLIEKRNPPPPPASQSEHIAEMAKKNATFFHNGNPITAAEAKEVIKNNKQVNISSHTNNGVSTVLLSNKPIETINGKQVKSNSNDCLSFNNTINFKQSNTTLKINCIENYPNNELKIFNRWGKMIYSKKGYNNSWNGKVDQEFTDNKDGSATQGTYYYVLNTGTKEEPTAGPLYIIN